MIWEEEDHVGSFIGVRPGSAVYQSLLPKVQWPDAGYVVPRKYK